MIHRKEINREDMAYLSMHAEDIAGSSGAFADRAAVLAAEMLKRRSRRARNPMLAEETPRSDTARVLLGAEKLRQLRGAGMHENSAALEASLASEGRLAAAEALLAKDQTFERDFATKPKRQSEMLQLTSRFGAKGDPLKVPTATARLRRRDERAVLADELARLEAELRDARQAKEKHLWAVSDPAGAASPSSRKVGGGLYARRATTATAHYHAMANSRSQNLILDRAGGYTTFGEQLSGKP